MFRAFFLLVVLFFVVPNLAAAATLYMDPPEASLNRGDAITIAVRLDTDEAAGECINAIDGVINYTESITPVDISVGRSILPVWVESPNIDKANRRITFAGGIPNGYCGRVEGDPRLTNVIAELVFRAPGLQVGAASSSDQADIYFAPETKAYLNDGFGTEASLSTLGTRVQLSGVVGNEILDDWRLAVNADEIPPEEFTITLEKDEFAAEGKYYIVFNTTDKQTGIDRYEVIEESAAEAGRFSFGAATAPWLEARSPYVLNDQTLRSTIRVRAIDKAGNEYVATLVPENMPALMPWYKTHMNILFIVAGVLVLLLAGMLPFWLYRRRRKVIINSVSDTDIQ
jgi:hypothetical protein